MLKRGIAQYNDLEFEKAITTLKAAINAGLSENDRIEAYKYLAFCYLVDDRTDEAKSAFLEILRIDYEYQLTGDIAPKTPEYIWTASQPVGIH